MQSYNMHYAKTHLSSLVEKAAAGEPFILAKAGKPMVKVVPLDTPAPQKIRRWGFMAGHGSVPADFDSMEADTIVALFEGTAEDSNEATG